MPLLAKASAPGVQYLRARPQPLGDLGVGRAIGGHENQLRWHDLPVRPRVATASSFPQLYVGLLSARPERGSWPLVLHKGDAARPLWSLM